jgi:LEM3 (ligand-effect modulator 3) family / CDC50 family
MCVQSSYTDFPAGVTCSVNSTNNYAYVLQTTGITWPSDSNKYGVSAWNSTASDRDQIPTKLIPPPYWRAAFPKWERGYNATNLPDLKTWERFQVWMRTAGLPTFRKLWGKNVDSKLPAGTWQVDITQSKT